MTRVITFLLTTLLITTAAITSQQTTTPTPAPTKTPEETTAEPESTAEISEDTTGEPVRTLTEPYTQTDLGVITGNVQRPNAMTWFEEFLYTICNGDWTVYKINSNTGLTETYVYGIRNSHTIYAETANETQVNLWAPDFDQNALTLINTSRTARLVTTALDGPWGIAYLDEESFLITNLNSDNIVHVTRDGIITELIAGLRSPTGIVNTGEFVFVANNGSSRRSIEWIELETLLDTETEDEREMQPLVSGLQNTTNVVLAPDGLLYFTYALGTRGVVGRVDPEFCMENGGCSNDQVEVVLFTELAAPLAGLTFSDDMRLFVHTIYRPEIYWVQIEG